MEECKCTREEAIKALRKHKGDPVEALLDFNFSSEKKDDNSIKKIPVKNYYRIDSDTQQDKSSNKNSSLNNIIYEYPISILKEPSQYEKYKERLILSGKPKKDRNILQWRV